MATGNDRPLFAFRVGITGHRDLDDPEISRYLPSRLYVRLQEIQRFAQQAARASQGFYHDEEDAILWAISPLAKGADRIFAKAALSLGYKLECPLPFDREEYRKDFRKESTRELSDLLEKEFNDLLERADGVFELDGSREHEPAAYETLGHVVLDQSDILLAIWDGTPAKGAGGTREVIGEARRRGIPVVCLHPDSGQPDTIFTAGDEGVPVTAKRIKHAVWRVLLPPRDLAQGRHAGGEVWLDRPDSLSATERCLAPIFGRFWRVFERVFTLGWRPSNTPAGAPRESGRVWRTFPVVSAVGGTHSNAPADAPPEPPSLDVFRERFDEKYEFWDKKANLLAGLYRGALLSIYVLGVCAVYTALFGNATGGGRSWPAIEMAVILVIVLLLIWSYRRRWHLRLADCRYLAEQFRILHHSYPLGLSPRRQNLPAQHLDAKLRDSWTEWFWRAWVRQTRMPRATVTAGYLEERSAAIGDWVLGQEIYHERNADRLKTIEDRLHGICWGSVAGVLVACVYHLVCDCNRGEPWLLLVTAGLPALSAAAHAISRQGEFGRLADRSESMSQWLASYLSELHPEGELSAAHLRRHTEELAQVLLDEVADWQILYRQIPPPPPP